MKGCQGEALRVVRCAMAPWPLASSVQFRLVNRPGSLQSPGHTGLRLYGRTLTLTQ